MTPPDSEQNMYSGENTILGRNVLPNESPMPASPIETFPLASTTSVPQSPLFLYLQNFVAEHSWYYLASIGVGLIIGAGMITSLLFSAIPSSNKPNASTTPTPSPTSSAETGSSSNRGVFAETATASPKATATPKASTTPVPTPQLPTPTPTPSPSPTPVPTPNYAYVLSRNEEYVSTPVHKEGQGYATYVILRKGNEVVTNQSNVSYTWWLSDSSLANITPFRGCTNGIQEPCPEDHLQIVAKKIGNTQINVRASWKDTGATITTTQYTLTVTAPPSELPKMNISFPTSGQTVTYASHTQICLVDSPAGGNTNGLKSRHNANNGGWSSYEPHSTFCFLPNIGSNIVEMQYQNEYLQESSVYTVTFQFAVGSP